jgi:hypothetical protein
VWSAVWSVPTDAGDVWFKANGGASTYEAGLLGVLAELVPDLVLRPLAQLLRAATVNDPAAVQGRAESGPEPECSATAAD